MRRLVVAVVAGLLFAAGGTLGRTAPVSQTPAPTVITNPDWAHRPSGADMAHYYPKLATRLGIGGHVTMECRVSTDGSVQNCEILSENPPDQGFGDAALRLSSLFQMSPMTRDGVPVGGAKVIIPIGFRIPTAAEWDEATYASCVPSAVRVGAAEPVAQQYCHCVVVQLDQLSVQARLALTTQSPELRAAAEKCRPSSSPGSIITNPDWARKPTADEMTEYYPERASRLGVGGHVSMECTVNADGSVSDCEIPSEDPPDQDFGAAALRMAPLFQMSPMISNGAPIGGSKVIVPIGFQVPAPTPEDGQQWDDDTYSSCIPSAMSLGAAKVVAERYCQCVVSELDQLTLEQRQALTPQSPELLEAANKCRAPSQIATPSPGAAQPAPAH